MTESENRDRVATIASMKQLFEPESIAVIGAGEHPGTPGHQLVANLVRSDFQGPVLPVNPHAEYVCGLPAVPSIGDAPYPVDLAVIVVPADAVERAVAECAAAGVGALVIISAGFAEVGPEGAERQRRVLALARSSAMRIVGPNCLGIANMAPNVRMNATFASADLPAGSVAVMTQSGAIGIAVVDGLRARGLGVSSFASVGNKADVSGNDLLRYWEQDASTRQIVLYLESFGNPRAFARIAPQTSLVKPVLAIKSGRSEVAAGAATSHTAALALPDDTVSALLRQSGVLRVDDVEELLDLCVALDSQPLPQGRNVAIVTNAGGPGVLASDACVSACLTPSSFTAATIAVLEAALGRSLQRRPGEAGPIDLRADASPQALAKVLNAVIDDPGTDAVLVVFADVSGADATPFVDAIGRVQSARPGKPMLCAFVPASNMKLAPLLATFAYPERAVRVLARLAERAEWLAEYSPVHDESPVGDPEAIRRLVDSAMAASPAGGWMKAVDAFRLVDLAGLDVAAPRYADSADAACEAATAIGYPVVLKVANPDMTHKSDSGGVKLGVDSEFEVASTFEVMHRHFGPTMGGVLVQAQTAPGLELLAGIVSHRELGPVVVIGEGGRLAEIRRDRAVRMPPLHHDEARRQLRSLRIAPLLDGFRGSPAVDCDLIADVLVRLGELAEIVPELATLDINPLIVTPRGVCAVDVKIRLQERSPDSDRPRPDTSRSDDSSS